MAYLKPQTPIQLNENYIYPLTTADQVMLGNGNRLNSLFKKTIQETATLQVANWSETLPYTQTITLTESTDDYNVDVNIAYNDVDNAALHAAAGCISYIKKNHKEITFYCLKSKPEVDIPVEITGTCRNTIANVTVEEGVKLNFDIVAYATEEELDAAQPKENTIGVITTTPITGYKFSSTEPENAVEGEVWISTGTTSDVKFDIANGVTIYPLSAKQYIGGVWVKKITMSYQSGEWNKWIFIIIQNSEFVHTSLESPDGAVVINTRNDGSGLNFYRTGTQYGALILKTKDKIPKHIEQIEIIGRFTSGSTNSNDYKIFFISEHETWPEAYNNRIATFSPFTTISATNSTEIIDLSGVNIDAYLWIAYSCGNNAANTAIVIKDMRELVLT